MCQQLIFVSHADNFKDRLAMDLGGECLQHTASGLSCVCRDRKDLYQLMSALPLNQPLCEQLLGSICAPLVFFLGVAEKLREILVPTLLGIAYVLVVSLSTLQRIIENADKVVGYICHTGVPGRSLSHSFLLISKGQVEYGLRFFNREFVSLF
jgi:hypothetical protein